MKIWSVDEEAKRLAKRFHGINRAAFARDYEISGGQQMIYQHITGRRPISLEAAQAYARGFGCKLDEISPRLAEEAKKAALSLGEVETPQETSLTKEQKQMLMFMSNVDKEARDVLLSMGRILAKHKSDGKTERIRPTEPEPEIETESYKGPDRRRSHFGIPYNTRRHPAPQPPSTKKEEKDDNGR
jgi:hypothetical protein